MKDYVIDTKNTFKKVDKRKFYIEYFFIVYVKIDILNLTEVKISLSYSLNRNSMTGHIFQ